MGNTCSRIEPSKNHWVVGTWIFQSGLTFESLIYQKQTWGLKIWQALEGLPFPNLFLLSSTWLPFASSWNGAWIGWLLRCVKRALEDGDSDNVESEIRRSPRKVGSVSPLYIIHPRNSPIFFPSTGSCAWGNVSQVFVVFVSCGGWRRILFWSMPAN